MPPKAKAKGGKGIATAPSTAKVPPAERPLSPREAAFITAYLTNGGNGKQAAIAAGYAEVGAHVQASRMLRRTNVIRKLEAANAKAEAQAVEATGISKAWVLDMLKVNLDRALTAEPVYDRAGLPTGEYAYEGSVANRALELIGKELGMFRETAGLTPKDVETMTEEQLQHIVTTGQVPPVRLMR